MEQPPSLHGNIYLEHLRTFRDQALEASGVSDARARVGALSIGQATAEWHTEDGGTAMLSDRGLRFGEDSPFMTYPTTLRIFNPINEAYGMTHFRMNLHMDMGAIRVYHTLFTKMSLTQILRAEISLITDRQHELDMPTNEQRQYLYDEMKRGASGTYRLAR